MSARTNKVVSLGLATAAIVYGCYPYVSGAHLEMPPAESKQPLLSTRLLLPNLPPLSQADPFRMPHATAKAVAKSTPMAKAATVKRGFDPEAALAGLTLEATTIRGTQRFAMINGRVYTEGAALPAAQVDGVRSVLARIECDRVLLRAEGHELELRYPRQTAARTTAVRHPGASGPQVPKQLSRAGRRDR